MPENSYMTYEDSSMVSYSLSLSFQELEPIFNSDYDNLVDNLTESEITQDPNNEEAFSISFPNDADSGGIGF